MNFFVISMIIMQAARLACGTCVFESDFGFALNCNFKQSGLFRVRNLGGVKAHFGLGFSVGDELGFTESLGNLEGGRRRSISYKNGPLPSNYVGVLPATDEKINELPEKHVSSRAIGAYFYTPQQLQQLKEKLPQMQYNPQQLQQLKETLQRQLHMVQTQAPASSPSSLMTEARPLPLGVPAFKPLPKPVTPPTAQRRTQSVAVDMPAARISVNNKMVQSYAKPLTANRTFHVANPTITSPSMSVPVFQAMPDSVAQFTQGVATVDSRYNNKHPNYLQFEDPKFDLQDVTVDELAKAANVSVDTIKQAIHEREQQLKAEQRAKLAAKLREEFIRTSTTTTTTTKTASTTTSKPNQISIAGFNELNNIESNASPKNQVSKVMNAPKEYYPVGYDKNFDDNFKSKVDLPPTSFSCAKQKHFPGLYADTDLGCMVFHVCALTDDGLVQKSFLCPESTLFDQTILKCNWWFYVDCTVSKSVYDSNIPISKSYQLMKSLTYFSKLNNNNGGDADESKNSGLDLKSLKESMESAGRQVKELKESKEVTEEPANEA